MGYCRTVSIGTDFEVFLKNAGTNEIVSAIDVVPGDKEKKHKVGKYEFHPDNVVAEVNVPPAYSGTEFAQNVHTGMELLTSMVAPAGLVPSIIDHHIMADKWLSHYKAMEFGCIPDRDIYTLREEEPASPFLAGNLRTAGGHIHIGIDASDSLTALAYMRTLASILSLVGVVMGDSPERRKLYGQAGRIRFKPYGMEVRTLGNAWLKSYERVHWIGSLVMGDLIPIPYYRTKMLDKYGGLGVLRHVVNTCDVPEAKKLLRNVFGVSVPSFSDANKPKHTISKGDVHAFFADATILEAITGLAAET